MRAWPCLALGVGLSASAAANTTTNLGVSGGHNAVTLTVGEHLFVLGDDNTVTWKPRDPKKAPELSDGGKRNKLARAK
jgi:hypothetical protein